MALQTNVLLSACALSLLAGCGGSTTEATSTPSPTSSAVSSPVETESASPTAIPSASTEIAFAIEDCENCVITAHQQAHGVDDTTWKSAPVQDGRTTLVVPLARTARMAFDVTGEDVTAGNAVAVVVLDYRGIAPGTEVSPDQATGASEGNDCWSGTDRATFDLNVRHQRVDVQAGPNDHVDVFWASPALAIDDDNWAETFHGGLGHQDAPYCR